MATRLSKDLALAELCHLDYATDADAGPVLSAMLQPAPAHAHAPAPAQNPPAPQQNAVAVGGSAPEMVAFDDETHGIVPTLSPVMPRRYNATTMLRALQLGTDSCPRCGRNPGGAANCCGTGGAWEGSCAHSYGSLVMEAAHTWDAGWRACNADAPKAMTAAQKEAKRRRLSHLLPTGPTQSQ